MRPSIQLSVIPDGQLVRVHAGVYDLDEANHALPLIEWSYDSGLAAPTDPLEVPLWATRIARQLHRHLADRLAPAELPARGVPFVVDGGSNFAAQFPQRLGQSCL